MAGGGRRSTVDTCSVVCRPGRTSWRSGPVAHTFTVRYDPKPGWYLEQSITVQTSRERKDEKPVKTEPLKPRKPESD
jgi:hypothetical protein